MSLGGRTVGLGVILITLLAVAGTILHTRGLELQREEAIAQLATMPGQENCAYDATTCPQMEEKVVIPDIGGIGLVLLGILLGLYLIRSDTTQRGILKELESKRSALAADERRELILSVLTKDEQRIINAVREQPGISQATLRLRTDMSKAKLSTLLKELEHRGLIAKTEDGKTNTVHLKREL